MFDIVIPISFKSIDLLYRKDFNSNE